MNYWAAHLHVSSLQVAHLFQLGFSLPALFECVSCMKRPCEKIDRNRCMLFEWINFICRKGLLKEWPRNSLQYVQGYIARAVNFHKWFVFFPRLWPQSAGGEWQTQIMWISRPMVDQEKSAKLGYCRCLNEVQSLVFSRHSWLRSTLDSARVFPWSYFQTASSYGIFSKINWWSSVMAHWWRLCWIH